MIAPALFVLAAPILASDPRIVTIGRFDRSEPGTLACEWSACEVRMKVKGDTLLVTAENSAKDFWQVVIDGKRTQVLTVQGPLAEYNIDLGSKAIHDVSLVKRTEPFVGTTRFRSFEIPKGEIYQAKRRTRLIEFVGDSITAAFGNEGASEKEHFKPETENAYLGYASLAARALDAEVRILAWSGRKMWPDNTMPEIYDRILPTKPAPQPDPQDAPPDAVVINLATNDFAPKNPAEAGWSAAYEAFVRKLRAKYPKAHIYAALGSMMTDDYPVGNQSLSTARVYLNRLVAKIGDPRFRLVEFDTQRYEDGIGSDWHPNLVTHRKMAIRLVEAIEKDLGWKRNGSLDQSMLLRAIRSRPISQTLTRVAVSVSTKAPTAGLPKPTADKKKAAAKTVVKKATAKKSVASRKRATRRRTTRRRVRTWRGKIVRRTKAPASARPLTKPTLAAAKPAKGR
ncbi:GDSL family lipase [bacterium]|nr:MAG: GDSL family lipase [bacterium]